jgi:nitrous oxidase accessory protein NosD
VHQGPIVLDHAQKLVGEAGAVVRGGIVVTADDVTVRDLTVVGGEHGIDVRDAVDVLIADVTVVEA